MTALTEQLSKLRSEWQGNPRLRIGGFVILIIGLVYLLLAMSDLKSAWATNYSEETSRLEKVRALSGQTIWLQREKEAKTLRDALDSEIPKADTAGLAQAAFQTKLREIAIRYGDGVRVQVSPANNDTGAPDIWRVPATLNGDMGLNQAQQLLKDIENQPTLITIETLSLTNRDRVHLNMAVQAYYRLPLSEVSHAP